MIERLIKNIAEVYSKPTKNAFKMSKIGFSAFVRVTFLEFFLARKYNITNETFLPNILYLIVSGYEHFKNLLTQCEMCPNTEFFLVRIQCEYGKIWTRKNSVFGHFPCSVSVKLEDLPT